MTQPSKAVAVTGASGYIGTRLLQELEEEGLSKLVAIDTRHLPLPVHNIATYRQDVTSPIGDALRHHRVTSLVHLAFVARRGRNRREINAIREANLSGLRAVLASCVEARVRHIIYLSSHTVYGAHRGNPVPLTEGAPLRPLPDFPYGYDKVLSEEILWRFIEKHPDIKVTILRPCLVLGPSADNDVTRAFFRPRLLGVQGYDPPLQFLDEGDLARILAIIIRREIPGVFNVAAEGVVFYREMAEIAHSKLVRLPSFLAYPLVQLTWNLGIQRDSTATELNMVRYPMLVSTGALEAATKYRFWYTSMEAMTAFANAQLL